MQDQTAIITGAADGIGWAMAQGFAEAGYRVLIADLDGDKAASRAAELGAAHAGAAVDVTRDSDVTALAELADARFGRCDVLVAQVLEAAVAVFLRTKGRRRGQFPTRRHTSRTSVA